MDNRRAVVILGGFLSPGWAYRGMARALETLSGSRVFVVGTHSYDWLPASRPEGWVCLLEKLDRTVQEASRSVAGERITLVGHSAGGVLSRLYLSTDPFLGRAYRGLERIDRLITLGSPHDNQGGMRRGGRMSGWVESRYPGAFFSPEVDYTAVAGKAIYGDLGGSPGKRMAYRTYRDLCGQGQVWGDGLIPVESALLKGAQEIVLEEIYHFPIFGGDWYGTPERIPLWWQPGNSE